MLAQSSRPAASRTVKIDEVRATRRQAGRHGPSVARPDAAAARSRMPVKQGCPASTDTTVINAAQDTMFSRDGRFCSPVTRAAGAGSRDDRPTASGAVAGGDYLADAAAPREFRPSARFMAARRVAGACADRDCRRCPCTLFVPVLRESRGAAGANSFAQPSLSTPSPGRDCGARSVRTSQSFLAVSSFQPDPRGAT